MCQSVYDVLCLLTLCSSVFPSSTWLVPNQPSRHPIVFSVSSNVFLVAAPACAPLYHELHSRGTTLLWLCYVVPSLRNPNATPPSLI